MKNQKLIAGLFFLFSILNEPKSFSQPSTNDLISRIWQFKMATSITECDINGTAAAPANNETANRHYQFRVVNVLSNGTLVIKFLFWNVPSTKTGGVSAFTPVGAVSLNASLNERFYMQNYLVNYFTGTAANHYRYFTIARTDFDTRCEEKLPKRQFSVGATTLPVKIRFGQKNADATNKSYTSFTGNISLGLSFGLKRNYNQSFAMNYLAGFSLSSVPVSSETTKNFVQNETNQAAITWHIGVLATINNFQIGIFSGVDYLSGKINKEWVYRNKPWLGVGIGFSFFNQKKTTDTQQ